MTSTMHAAPDARAAWRGGRSATRRIAEAVEGAGKRLTGPGGYYNVGNAIGLAVGIGLQVGAAPGRARCRRPRPPAWHYLAGNAGGGGAHARRPRSSSGAARPTIAPGRTARRRTTRSTGAATCCRGSARWSSGWRSSDLGQPVLAADRRPSPRASASSAAPGAGGRSPGWPSDWPNLYRSAVLASRVPAIIAAAYELLCGPRHRSARSRRGARS